MDVNANQTSNQTTEKSNAGNIFFIIFGVIIIGMGIFFNNQSKAFVKKADIVDAIVTEVDRNYEDEVLKVIVEYEYNGEYYSGKLDSWSNMTSEGDIVEIYVDPDNPSKFTHSGTAALWPVVMIIFGVLSIIMAIAAIILQKKKAGANAPNGPMIPNNDYNGISMPTSPQNPGQNYAQPPGYPTQGYTQASGYHTQGYVNTPGYPTQAYTQAPNIPVPPADSEQSTTVLTQDMMNGSRNTDDK